MIRLTPFHLDSLNQLKKHFPHVPDILLLFSAAISSGNWRAMAFVMEHVFKLRDLETSDDSALLPQLVALTSTSIGLIFFYFFFSLID